MEGWRGQILAILAAALCAVALLALAPRLVRAVDRAPVSVAIVLAVDVSASINGERFQLQREGYAAAIVHPAVLDAVTGSPRGSVALMVVEWAGAGNQRVVVPWTRVAAADDARRAAAVLLAAPRSFDGLTAIGAAIAFAAAQLAAVPWPADRRVIDVSGDGTSNDGAPPGPARDAAVALGIVVNGIAIRATPPRGGEQPLDDYYREHVAGGPGAFVMAADGFEAFAFALVAKLAREVAGGPRPVAGIDVRTAGR